ncbi:MAG: prepilin peptidase [Candidatus Omnitrophota bacterium]
MIGLFVFIFGLIVGSFLNVCIYRMPREISPAKGRSFCPHCKKQIAWYDNIPLFSYIVLLGKCRSCKAKISIQYFIVELIAGGLFLLTYFYFGITLNFFIYLILLSGLIISTFIDIEHRIIPDEISIGGVVVGFLIALILAFIKKTPFIILDSFLGIIIGGGVIYLTGMLGDFLFKKESMGGGDVKLLAAIGAFLGWKKALLSFFIAPVFGAIIGIVVLIKYKDHYIPYGPFLSIGAIIALFWGDKLLRLLFWF